ncbi:hypothetical protein [Rubripirellula obstinata]|uniref:hypothetical protein n=1 Tax=Rubripirellula obstinata TaxID=406547 RepID=UPI0012F91856|nr:hypothetical protein [Rubripirellula obstinata]
MNADDADENVSGALALKLSDDSVLVDTTGISLQDREVIGIKNIHHGSFGPSV